MVTYLFLTKFWGIMLIFFCLALIMLPNLYNDLLEGLRNKAMLFIYSVVIFILGAAAVSLMASWTIDGRGLVTLLGLSALVKGVWGIFFPEKVLAMIERFKEQRLVLVFVSYLFLAVGIYLMLITS